MYQFVFSTILIYFQEKMPENRKVDILSSGSPFKIVGLIASVVATLACFVGAVTWISLNIAENAVTIETIQKSLIRHESLITKNSEIINQHRQLLAIINEHGKAIDVLTGFMTQGGRFTEADGHKLYSEVQKVKDRLRHYEVLEVELGWIKKSITDMEKGLNSNFNKLGASVDIIADKQNKVYEGHMGEFHKSRRFEK
jgi:hypothetical protein